MSPELLPGQLAATVAEAGPGPPPRPKLRRSDRRPDPGRWRDVIPPLLAEQVADSEQLATHRKLVGRVEAAAAKLVELRTAHKQAVEVDGQAEQAFATGRRAKLPPPTAPAAAVEASGVATPARIYDLRSTFASNALAAGIDVFELALVLATRVVAPHADADEQNG